MYQITLTVFTKCSDEAHNTNKQ